MKDRLVLTEAKIQTLARGVRMIAAQEEPIGKVSFSRFSHHHVI
jgi:gamma-glutamyl phosphate reductase